VKRTERSDGPADRAASTKYVSVDAEPAVRSADPLEALESPERVVCDSRLTVLSFLEFGILG